MKPELLSGFALAVAVATSCLAAALFARYRSGACPSDLQPVGSDSACGRCAGDCLLHRGRRRQIRAARTLRAP